MNIRYKSQMMRIRTSVAHTIVLDTEDRWPSGDTHVWTAIPDVRWRQRQPDLRQVEMRHPKSASVGNFALQRAADVTTDEARTQTLLSMSEPIWEPTPAGHQRLAGQRRMEEGEAAPVGREAAPQVSSP